MKKIILFLTIFILFLALEAKDADIPPALQVGLFSRVFQYSPELEKEFITIQLVYSDADYAKCISLKNEFEDAGFIVIISNIKDEFKAEGDVVYYFSKALQDIKSYVKPGVLTIAIDSEYAEDGKVSLALGLVNNLPRVYLNLDQLEREKITMSARLLQIAIVIKGEK
jgi:hypothetical protein